MDCVTRDGLDNERVLAYLEANEEANTTCFRLGEDAGVVSILSWNTTVPRPSLATLRSEYPLCPGHLTRRQVADACDAIIRATDTFFASDAPPVAGIDDLREYRRAVRQIPLLVTDDMTLDDAFHKLFPEPPLLAARIVCKCCPFFYQDKAHDHEACP